MLRHCLSLILVFHLTACGGGYGGHDSFRFGALLLSVLALHHLLKDETPDTSTPCPGCGDDTPERIEVIINGERVR